MVYDTTVTLSYRPIIMSVDIAISLILNFNRSEYAEQKI